MFDCRNTQTRLLLSMSGVRKTAVDGAVPAGVTVYNIWDKNVKNISQRWPHLSGASLDREARKNWVMSETSLQCALYHSVTGERLNYRHHQNSIEQEHLVSMIATDIGNDAWYQGVGNEMMAVPDSLDDLRNAKKCFVSGGHRVNGVQLGVETYPESDSSKWLLQHGHLKVTLLFPNTPPDGIDHFIGACNRMQAKSGCQVCISGSLMP